MSGKRVDQFIEIDMQQIQEYEQQITQNQMEVQSERKNIEEVSDDYFMFKKQQNNLSREFKNTSTEHLSFEQEESLYGSYFEINQSKKLKILQDFLRIFVPTVFGQFISMMQEVINLIFVAQMNDASMLAGVGMGNVIMNISCLSLIFGMNGALETLVSQSYGQGNLELCGVYLNRGRFIITCGFIPIAFFLMRVETILDFLGQDQQVAFYAQKYTLAYLPGLYVSGLFDCQRRFLNCLQKNQVPFLAVAFGQIIHIFLSWYFVLHLNYGILGTGIASGLTNFFALIIVLIFTYCTDDIKEAVFLPDRRSYVGLSEYLKIGIPQTIMACSEWWAYELQTILTGYLGVKAQATQIIIFNFTSLTYSFGVGLQTTSCTLIGVQIGNNRIKNAKTYFNALKLIALMIIMFVFTTFMIARLQFFQIFTSDNEIIELAMQASPIVALGLLPDLWQAMVNGIIRALGLQQKAANLNLIAYWLINVSISLFLSFYYKNGYLGIRYGIVSAQLFLAFSFTILVGISDWDEIAAKAIIRQKKEIEFLKNINESNRAYFQDPESDNNYNSENNQKH